MSLWKQALVTVALLVAAAMGAARFLPATHPLLDRIGLLAPLDRIGLVSRAEAPEAAQGARGAGPALIVADQARTEVLTDTVTAIGTARGARSVVLASEVAGRIVAITVASGDFVKAGETIIGAGQRGGPHRGGPRGAGGGRRAGDAGPAGAAEGHGRLDRPSGAGGGAGAEDRRAGIARGRIRRCRSHRILAPISGWVGILAVEIGNQVARERRDHPDRGPLQPDRRFPGAGAGRQPPEAGRPGQRLAAGATPARCWRGVISALDNRVDETSRTLRVQAAIGNADDRAARRAWPSRSRWPSPARRIRRSIRWRSSGGRTGPLSGSVREGKASALPVRILQRNATRCWSRPTCSRAIWW